MVRFPVLAGRSDQGGHSGLGEGAGLRCAISGEAGRSDPEGLGLALFKVLTFDVAPAGDC